MELYLNSLDFKFSFIGLSETWLDDNKEEFYDLKGYSSVNRYRKEKVSLLCWKMTLTILTAK